MAGHCTQEGAARPEQRWCCRAAGDSLANRNLCQEGVFLLTVSGERRIKRLQRLAGGALYLISDNEHYQPEMITPQQMGGVEILGRCEIRIGRVL
ncbi:MAG: S24 family peptidase [Halomonadaceae bacterium]